MRDIFIKHLIELIKKDPSVILITADLGFGSFDQLSQNFPDNFLNVGVAEQNMIGVASGMAMQGRKPFCYSIGNFTSLRCLEQIRNDASYHELDICIVSNGGGFSYGGLGVSHHSTEDVSIMLSLPEIEILTPSTDIEIEYLVKYAYSNKGTKYLRLDKLFETESSMKADLKPIREIKKGKNNKIYCYGSIIGEAFRLRNLMKKDLGIYSVPIISSISEKNFLDSLADTKKLIVLEENALNGGLGALISNIILKNNIHLESFHAFGLPRKFAKVVGDQDFMRKYFNLNAESIMKILSKNNDD